MVFFKKSYNKATGYCDKKIIKEMDDKCVVIMDITEEIYDNKFVFYDFFEFLDFLDLVIDFKQEWDENNELSEVEEKKVIEHLLYQIGKLTERNNKHYGRKEK